MEHTKVGKANISSLCPIIHHQVMLPSAATQLHGYPVYGLVGPESIDRNAYAKLVQDEALRIEFYRIKKYFGRAIVFRAVGSGKAGLNSGTLVTRFDRLVRKC